MLLRRPLDYPYESDKPCERVRYNCVHIEISVAKPVYKPVPWLRDFEGLAVSDG